MTNGILFLCNLVIISKSFIKRINANFAFFNRVTRRTPKYSKKLHSPFFTTVNQKRAHSARINESRVCSYIKEMRDTFHACDKITHKIII